jgi:probable F420-dependent oxidoreductase
LQQADFMKKRPFRFGAQFTQGNTLAEVRALVRQVESDGFWGVFTPDHYAGIPLATGGLLATVAQLSSKLQVGALVYDNDFRHPLLLAREAATLEVLSEGRFICGIGAGWYEGEYHQVGLSWDAPGVRISRLEEALPLLLAAWSGETFSHQGKFYQVQDHGGLPVARPRLMVGGGGKRMLGLAGKHADIVNLNAKLDRGFGEEMTKFSDSDLHQMIAWVREGAGDRFEEIELSVPVFFGAVDDEARVAEMAAAQGYTVEQARSSPNYLFGSRQEIVDRLHHLREEFGISLFILSDFGCDLQKFAPIVRELGAIG